MVSFWLLLFYKKALSYLNTSLTVLWVRLFVLTEKQLFDLYVIKMSTSPEEEIFLFFFFVSLHRQNLYKDEEEGD